MRKLGQSHYFFHYVIIIKWLISMKKTDRYFLMKWTTLFLNINIRFEFFIYLISILLYKTTLALIQIMV